MAVSIGQFLRNKRESLKMKQKDLADAVGLSSAYINRVEKGESKPAPGFLEKVSQILNLDYVDLYLQSLEDRHLPDTLIAELRNLKQLRPQFQPGKPLWRFQNCTHGLTEEEIETILLMVESVSLMIIKARHKPVPDLK
jgi:transcriptional regulator with XRE-family HTH domain